MRASTCAAGETKRWQPDWELELRHITWSGLVACHAHDLMAVVRARQGVVASCDSTSSGRSSAGFRAAGWLAGCRSPSTLAHLSCTTSTHSSELPHYCPPQGYPRCQHERLVIEPVLAQPCILALVQVCCFVKSTPISASQLAHASGATYQVSWRLRNEPSRFTTASLLTSVRRDRMTNMHAPRPQDCQTPASDRPEYIQASEQPSSRQQSPGSTFKLLPTQRGSSRSADQTDWPAQADACACFPRGQSGKDAGR